MQKPQPANFGITEEQAMTAQIISKKLKTIGAWVGWITAFILFATLLMNASKWFQTTSKLKGAGLAIFFTLYPGGFLIAIVVDLARTLAMLIHGWKEPEGTAQHYIESLAKFKMQEGIDRERDEFFARWTEKHPPEKLRQEGDAVTDTQEAENTISSDELRKAQLAAFGLTEQDLKAARRLEGMSEKVWGWITLGLFIVEAIALVWYYWLDWTGTIVRVLEGCISLFFCMGLGFIPNVIIAGIVALCANITFGWTRKSKPALEAIRRFTEAQQRLAASEEASRLREQYLAEKRMHRVKTTGEESHPRAQHNQKQKPLPDDAQKTNTRDHDLSIVSDALNVESDTPDSVGQAISKADPKGLSDDIKALDALMQDLEADIPSVAELDALIAHHASEEAGEFTQQARDRASIAPSDNEDVESGAEERTSKPKTWADWLKQRGSNPSSEDLQTMRDGVRADSPGVELSDELADMLADFTDMPDSVATQDDDLPHESSVSRSDEAESIKKAPEGERVLRTRYEPVRDPRLREAAIVIHGRRCCVCGFSFDKRYGESLARGYIEVHHLKSIADGERNTDPHTDLAPLCANCHVMADRLAKHEFFPPTTITELKALLLNRKQPG